MVVKLDTGNGYGLAWLSAEKYKTRVMMIMNSNPYIIYQLPLTRISAIYILERFSA
jgi:hypothetical protein